MTSTETIQQKPSLSVIGQGTRLCISGLGSHATTTARQVIMELGAEATSFRAGADAIVLADNASANDRAEALAQGFTVFTLSELTRLARGAEEDRPAIEAGTKSLRVLDIEIPYGSEPPSQDASRFKHLCLDRLFLTTARKAALAVRHGIPCMLEGETATAKTTAILWLAMMARQNAIRVNLSGHTDTGELVGRFIPSTQSGENRPAWEFSEGYIPRALRNGWWVILDEVNLAEPQVLERLNPVLELPPTLVLTEHDGRRFGDGGDVPISENFRLFGTINPSEYAGRATLSPAFRDRWGIWGHIGKPSEPELLDMLRCLVTGESPTFVWEGVRWIPPRSEPIYPSLADFPDLEMTLKSISSFHARISGAAGDNEAPASIGRVRRERYVFTRRTLLNAMRLIHENAKGASRLRGITARVMAEIYIQRLADPADRAAALALLRATGLA